MQDLLLNVNRIVEPYVHVTDKLNKFNHLYKQARISNGNLHKRHISVIDGENCSIKARLYKEFSNQLHFPDYFSENWDSFDEIINDLSWINANQYILFFKNFDLILSNESKDLAIFSECIADSIKSWNTGKNRVALKKRKVPFHIIIHSKNRHIDELKSSLDNLKINLF